MQWKSLKMTKKNEAELNKKIKSFEENPNLEEQVNYNNAKMQLQFLSECRIKGQILRSKTNYYEYGEKSTKFFLNLEKKRAESSTLSCLMDENGILQTEYKNILKIIKNFYSKLFEKKFDVDRVKTMDFLARLELPKISDEHRNLCEQDITKDEIF